MRYLLPCPVCLQPHQMEKLPEGDDAYCIRCGALITAKPRDSLHRTFAFAFSALLLYVPANILPVIRIEQNGVTSDSTVYGSVQLLWDSQDHFVAIIVFLASIVIPVFKLLGLFYLSISIWLGATHAPHFRSLLYRFIDSIGRFAMLDVFVLAVLVSVVKLQSLATVSPGEGALPFALVVCLSLAASGSFDSHLIWINQRLCPRSGEPSHA